MKTLTLLSILAVIALSFAALTTRAVAVSPQAPGGTPGAPGSSGTPVPPGGLGPQTNPGAQAAGHGKPMLYRGTIAAVDASSLTLTLRDGSAVTIGLSPDTKINIPGPKSEPAGLVVGMQVSAWAFTDTSGNLVARAVIAIPGKPSIVHRVGTVTEYTPGSSITITGPDGNPYTFALTSATKILPAERATDLAVGARVTVIAPRDPGALGWTATGIVVHPPAGP